jgi:hypothetical protein
LDFNGVSGGWSQGDLKPLTSWLQISARSVCGGRWSRSAVCGSLARTLQQGPIHKLQRHWGKKLTVFATGGTKPDE